MLTIADTPITVLKFLTPQLNSTKFIPNSSDFQGHDALGDRQPIVVTARKPKKYLTKITYIVLAIYLNASPQSM